jgi:hypothetical protein
LRLFPVRTKTKQSNDWMVVTIGDNHYEVMEVDIWYVQLYRNGELIFDGRRFDNEEFTKLLV